MRALWLLVLAALVGGYLHFREPAAPELQPGDPRHDTGESRIVMLAADWCGYCRAAQPHIAAALSGRDGLRHIKVADASGKRLGRSFGVKLWPTLVFVRVGAELARLVRPGDADSIRDALARIGSG